MLLVHVSFVEVNIVVRCLVWYIQTTLSSTKVGIYCDFNGPVLDFRLLKSVVQLLKLIL